MDCLHEYEFILFLVYVLLNIMWTHFLLMCESRGRCLVINSSYHICILFIFNPLLTTLCTCLGLPHPIVPHLSQCWCDHTIYDLNTHLFRCPYMNQCIAAHDTFRILSQLLLWKVEHMFRRRSSTFSLATPDDEWISLSLEVSFGRWMLSLLTQFT